MKLMINESKYNSTIRQYLDKVFGGMDVWGKSFLNLVNQKYGTTATNIG
jgi:hypothetical protein